MPSARGYWPDHLRHPFRGGTEQALYEWHVGTKIERYARASAADGPPVPKTSRRWVQSVIANEDFRPNEEWLGDVTRIFGPYPLVLEVRYRADQLEPWVEREGSLEGCAEPEVELNTGSASLLTASH